MKTKLLYIIVLFLIFAGTSCENKAEIESLPSNQAKGKIIEVLDGCLGDIVIIEIENPKNLGYSGVYNYYNKELKYNNAIGVPYFSKISSQRYEDIVQKAGTWVYFEFRNKTNEDDALYMSNIPCPAIYGRPNINYFVITKMINYQNSTQ